MSTPAAPRRWSSAIYRGRLQHRRHSPQPHRFDYPLFMFYLDLAEIDELFRPRWFWSLNRRNLGEFRRSDFLGDATRPLDACVRDEVERATGVRPGGPIRMLAHLRYFGHCFNPVSFYYCFDASGEQVDTIVAEITNTPWNERHRYVLPVSQGEAVANGWRWGFRKEFHVSPFLPLDRDYRWRFAAPGAQLQVQMDVLAGDGKDFDATLSLQREDITTASLARCLLRHPALTLRIVVAIHWQALRLWLKRNPVYDHPGKAKAVPAAAAPVQPPPRD